MLGLFAGIISFSGELDELAKSYESLNKNVGKEWLLPAEMTGLDNPDQDYETSLRTIRDWAGSLVDKRTGQTGQPDDALTALMGAVDPDSGRPYSRERLVSEVQNLMLAGHETTANLITWTITEIARNPVKQAAIRAEIGDTCGPDVPSVAQVKP